MHSQLDELFYALPESHLSDLSLQEKARQNDATLRLNLETCRDCFREWRSFFESDSLGHSGFLLEFIHIVCDYATSRLDGETREGVEGVAL